MHFMIDLETLSTAPDAVIMQIGVAAFDPHAQQVWDPAIINVNPQSCIDLGLRVDWPTIRWWMSQDQAVIATLPSDHCPVKLDQAMGQLSAYLLRFADLHRPEFVGEEPFIWSHGASFDIPILASAYRAVGLKEPWKHWNVRDTRTVGMLCPGIPREKSRMAHNAGTDAYAQAKWMVACLNNLRR